MNNDDLIRGYQAEIAVVGSEINRKQKQLTSLNKKYEYLKKELTKLRSKSNDE